MSVSVNGLVVQEGAMAKTVKPNPFQLGSCIVSVDCGKCKLDTDHAETISVDVTWNLDNTTWTACYFSGDSTCQKLRDSCRVTKLVSRCFMEDIKHIVDSQ